MANMAQSETEHAAGRKGIALEPRQRFIRHTNGDVLEPRWRGRFIVYTIPTTVTAGLFRAELTQLPVATAAADASRLLV